MASASCSASALPSARLKNTMYTNMVAATQTLSARGILAGILQATGHRKVLGTRAGSKPRTETPHA
jgi:hypothetical protein